ncbi:MAG: hypothetical protein VYD87_13355 [Pseudomonadota bacterium]|nr:hypothetical protein [Pseudomonadota bacterium]
MEAGVDLFGDVVTLPSGKRGRPAHVACQKNRNKVIMLLALGWSNQRIAGALHISLPTLRRYYFSELKARDVQRDRLDAWRFEVVAEKAATGDIPAMKELGRLIDRNDRALAAARVADEPQAEPLGKKEEARRAATDLSRDGGAWGGDLRVGWA